MSLNISKNTINYIANKIRKQRQLCLLNSEKPKFHHRHRAKPSIVHRITSSINKEISSMATRCHISIGTAFRIIRDIIHARCRKKKSVH